MEDIEKQGLEELAELQRMLMDGQAKLARARELQAGERALARVMLRDDIVSCELRSDGTLESVDINGHTTIRPGGWRGR